MGTSQQDRDFAWYVGEMPELYRRYGHCYAIISGEAAVETFDDCDDAIDSAMAMEDDGTIGHFIVQEIGSNESAYTANFASAWVI
jgi:hypothetical protein